MEAIEVTNLTKQFDSTRVLEGITFNIGEGKLILLLGPNGSGKTTLLRCLMGLIRFEGEVRIFGFDVSHMGKQARRLVGYMPQDSGFYADMTCAQVLDFFSNLKGVDVSLEDLLGPIGLLQKADAKVKQLSGGMKRKLGIAVTLLGDPPIIFLDEPFSDIDAKGKLDLLNTIRALRERGRTVVISTHTISGVLTMADEALVLQRNMPIRTIRSQLFASHFSPTYRVHVYSKERIPIKEAEVSPTGWVTISSRDLHSTLNTLAEYGIDISKAIVEEPTTNDLMMGLAGDDL